jgi:L-malate glycosyltransferase
LRIILHIGNRLSKHGLTPSPIELLGPLLSSEGFNMSYAGDKKNPVSRLLQMIIIVLRSYKMIDFVLIDTYSTLAFWYSFIIGKICSALNLKYILILHGGNLPKRQKKIKLLFNRLLNKSFMNIAVSKYLYNELQLYNYKSIIIPNIIDISKYRYQLRTRPKPKLLWVRSFHSQYNPIMAMEVFLDVLKYHDDAKLCMVGPDKDGSMEKFRNSTILYRTTPNVKITGKLSKQEWIQLSRDYDFFINTSNIDNTPVSVIEALALGLCVVSTNPGGMPYLLDHDKNAMLCNPGDSKKMAEYILMLLSDQERYSRLVKAGREKAMEFSWELVREKWIDLLK